MLYLKSFLYFFPVILLFITNKAYSQTTITGYSGIIMIPTAEISGDGVCWLGAGYVPAGYAEFRLPRFYSDGKDHGERTYFATVGFLPFLEISAAYTIPDYDPKGKGVGDRRTAFRFRLMKESEKRPTIAFGIHDPFGFLRTVGKHNQHFTATYIVLSKNIQLKNMPKLSIHTGYGVDWIEAANHQFVGFFGGITVNLRKYLSFLTEYDSEKINMGFKVCFLKHLQLLGCILDFKNVSASVSYKIKL